MGPVVEYPKGTGLGVEGAEVVGRSFTRAMRFPGSWGLLGAPGASHLAITRRGTIVLAFHARLRGDPGPWPSRYGPGGGKG